MQPGCLTVAACFSAANLVQRKLVACTATAMTIPSGFSSFRDPIELEVLSDLSLRQVAVKSTSRTLGGWFIARQADYSSIWRVHSMEIGKH
jgi:hypothetical protein